MNEIRAKVMAVKGMSDVLPTQIATWQYLENIIRKLMHSYTYEEIRMPIVERTQLFSRSVGEVTDIVEKEMYSFDDRNSDSLTLRPEGTAGCVRAGIEHALFRNQQQQKLWYLGPMFRYEKPQKGRYRQFMQLGVEAFNLPGPDIDAEQLALSARLWQMLNIDKNVELQLNSIGDLQSRAAYKKQLVTYFNDNLQQLDADSLRRLTTNPMRILDSKNADMQQLISSAPILLDYIDAQSAEHFQELQQILTMLGIKFTINPRIVRGLDYYNRTVFEWVTDQLGSQSAICAGGRYDSLVETLGGPSTNSVGFAMGLERIILLLEATQQKVDDNLDGYLLCIGEAAEKKRLLIAEQIRSQLPDFGLLTNMGTGGSFASLFKKADKSGAKVALIVGDTEIINNTIGIKYLRSDKPQQTVSMDQIKAILGEI